MPTFPVKWYSSDMEGAPVVDNTWGRITNLLDKVLVQGFNSKTALSLVRSGTTCTLTFTSHGFFKDQIIRIEGTGQAEYNTDHRVTAVTPTTVVFEVSGTPTTPATGTITVSTPAIGGWEIYKDGTGTWNTNRRAYRSTNPSSNKPVLWIDDGINTDPVTYPTIPVYNTAYAKRAKVAICEDMFDIDSPNGAFAPFSTAISGRHGMFPPTGSGVNIVDGWLKWYYGRQSAGATTSDSSGDTGAGARRWYIIGDDRTFYFFIGQYAGFSGFGHTYYKFGEFASYKQNDKYASILTATSNANSAATTTAAASNYPNWSTVPMTTLDSSGKVCLREYVQYGVHASTSFTTLNPINAAVTSGVTTGIPFPNEANFGLILTPSYVFSNSFSSFRGKMPGEYWILNNMTSTNNIPEGTVVENITEFPGRKFLLVGFAEGTTVYNPGRVAFDITGPWW